MKAKKGSPSLRDPQLTYKGQNEVIRNFQQLLKLKLMREERKKVVVLNLKPKPEPLTVRGSGDEQQQPSKKKSFQIKSNKHKNSNILSHESFSHLQVNSLHIRTEANILVATSKVKLRTEVNQYERRSLSHRNHILSHLQHVRSLQQKYLRSKEKLIDQKCAKLKKKSVGSLQSIGSGILPLTPPSHISSLNQLLRLRTLSKEEAGVEERQKSRKSSRYSDIPISEFLYENNRRPIQVSSGTQRKIESICRTQEKATPANYQKQRQAAAL